MTVLFTMPTSQRETSGAFFSLGFTFGIYAFLEGRNYGIKNIYKRRGGVCGASVTVSDEIPANMQYVSGSTVLINSGNRTGVIVENDALIEGGLNIGSYHSGEDARVQFTAEAKDAGLVDSSEKLVNQSKVIVDDKVLHKHTEVTVKYGWGGQSAQPTNLISQPTMQCLTR